LNDALKLRRIILPKKRKSGGRGKGGKGRSDFVQCYNCGKPVPRDKAKRIRARPSLVDSSLFKELRSSGTFIARQDVYKFYCVSCAVHFGVAKVRAKDERKRAYRR
jgi:small subunit ribosomal protein S26e